MEKAGQDCVELNILTELGQSGDAFGGGNALFAAIAGGLVFWAGFMQAKSLKEARAAYDRQQFESTFFELIKLTRELVEKMLIPQEAGVIHDRPIGAAALDSFAASVVKRMSDELAYDNETKAVQLVRNFSKQVYGKHPSAFGPYFRSMYQTFKHVADSRLTEKDKIQYANIARGQISEGAVLLLALNGLTKFGFNFIPHIEQFGLLEHMHRQYLKAYKDALLIGYHERAFLGSKEREKHPFEPTQKQTRDFFVRKPQEPIAAGGARATPERET